MTIKILFTKTILLTFFIFFTTNTQACEKQVESYVIKHYLGSHFVNSCDGYRDCMDPAELIRETESYNTYRVFVFFGNSGGYPSVDKFVVTTDKNCNVINDVE